MMDNEEQSSKTLSSNRRLEDEERIRMLVNDVQFVNAESPTSCRLLLFDRSMDRSNVQL